MGRTFVAGAVSIAKNKLRDAQRAPFLGLCVVDRSDNVRIRVKSIKDLKPSASRYDDARAIWFFELALHDDDLPNASFEPLLKFLETVPSKPGAAFIAARDDWQNEPYWYALVLDGRAQERPHLEAAAATELVARLDWPPAAEVLAALRRSD